MNTESTDAAEESEFQDKIQTKCVPDDEVYRIKKERDSFWSQVQQLRLENQRLQDKLNKYLEMTKDA